VAKGEHTRHQLTLLDSVMETRIRLQQSLNIVNRLPQVWDGHQYELSRK
jgi:hypothetical protein